MPSITDHAPAVESVANPSELADVSPAMGPVVAASRQIFDQAIDDATGNTKQERRAAIDAAVEGFRQRHYRAVLFARGLCDDCYQRLATEQRRRANPRSVNETSDPATVARSRVPLHDD